MPAARESGKRHEEEERPVSDHLDAVSRVYGPATWDLYELLDQSIGPRGPDMMQEQAVARAGLEDRIEIVRGVMQELPYPDDHFDVIWCRDVVEVVEPLELALREAARVLKPGGHMLVYTNFVTDRLEAKEAAMMSRSLVNVPANLIERGVENAFSCAGLTVARKDVIGTEWREYTEERARPASQALLRLARLRRQRERIVERFGEDIYDHVEANLHWLVYQFLGKLQPTMYVLRKD